MKVSELQARQGKVNIELEIISVETPREFNKFGNTGRVANAAAKDDSGEIKLTLWNGEIDQVKAGDKVRITNGYVSEFQGEKQLSAGKFGKLEII
ncbi:DNA-binding protein [Candidatus Woesearchaeota archaeon]|nr:DNA-binding protein [Candidatus Woesearchaeota archaeon]